MGAMLEGGAGEGEDATVLLAAAADGTAGDAERLYPLVYNELRALAQHILAADGGTAQATDVVHEAYLRLIDQRRARLRDRDHFMSVAAMAMRRVVVDHARSRRAAKRGGGVARLDLTTSLSVRDAELPDVEALDRALAALEGLDEREARAVEMFYFGGMTVDEIARALGVSARTAAADLSHARAWLRVRMESG